MFLYIILPILLIVIAILIDYLRRQKKPKSPLRAGDVVLLKKKYRNEFRELPSNHPLSVVEVNGDNVLVVYMKDKNKINESTVKLNALEVVP